MFLLDGSGSTQSLWFPAMAQFTERFAHYVGLSSTGIQLVRWLGLIFGPRRGWRGSFQRHNLAYVVSCNMPNFVVLLGLLSAMMYRLSSGRH